MPAESDRANAPPISRDELALKYLEQLPFTPYPVQEQALFAWFGADEGVLVCAPTGMGKTLIAEAAAFEALSTGSTIYYTTPLIALTDQKFQEIQAPATPPPGARHRPVPQSKPATWLHAHGRERAGRRFRSQRAVPPGRRAQKTAHASPK